jgi:GNAT superfamily N-acetyltransferase
MTFADVPDVDRVTDDAFYDIDVRTRPADWPAPERRDPERAALWRRRMEHLITHDSPGCWVAEDDSGELVGAVAALLRERLWGLSTYAVRPGTQATGVGKQLLDAALTYADPEGTGFICSSHDPRAVRRYALAGFAMHPTALIWGSPRRVALPAVSGVREGSIDDIELMDAADRVSRGAGHGVDHILMAEQYRSLVIDEGDRFGYAYVYASGRPYLLAATDEGTAGRLLWECLGSTTEGEPIDLGYLTGQHQWAIQIGLQCGMEVHNRGFLALRGMQPAPAYLPSGHFL